MKFVRFLAIAPLALVSVANVGYPFATDPTPDVALAIAVAVVGLAGFVAAFGLARNATWGIPAVLAVASVNVVAAIIALVLEADGAIVGLVVSSLALVLAVIAGSAGRKVSLA
jgi:hypothetical protein